MSAGSDLTLYSYFRSSAAFRVRIALGLKGLHADMRFVHLLKDGGAQHGGDYKKIMSSLHTRVLALPDDTIVIPGHGPSTTIGDERETNPFLIG